MTNRKKYEQKKPKETNEQVYDAFTYNFIDDNRSNFRIRKQDMVNDEYSTNMDEEVTAHNTYTNKRNKCSNKNESIIQVDNDQDCSKKHKCSNKNGSMLQVDNNNQDCIKRQKCNDIRTNDKNDSIPHVNQEHNETTNQNISDTNVQNNVSTNETRFGHNNTEDIVTIENRRNPYFTYQYSSATSDEIRINSMRNNGDIRITRQEYNISDNRTREMNDTSNNVNNIITGNESLDSFFRLQFSFYYPNLNREYLYDVYIENNENDISVLSDTNNGINVVNETRHNFAEYTNTRFTERLNESFSTLFSLFQNVMYSNKIKVLSKKDLKKIKLVKYVPKNEKEECSVCMEYFKKNENVRLLNCLHFFHGRCVDKWFLNESNQCPICRKEVLIDEKQ